MKAEALVKPEGFLQNQGLGASAKRARRLRRGNSGRLGAAGAWFYRVHGRDARADAPEQRARTQRHFRCANGVRPTRRVRVSTPFFTVHPARDLRLSDREW